MKDPLTMLLGDTESLESEYLENAEPDTEKYTAIQDVISQSHLESSFESKWKPAKIQLVQNKGLADDFAEKKQDMLIRGRKENELEEKFGFAVENNVAALQLNVSVGQQTRDSEYNALGYNRMGIYLCKHADVCLQHALVKYSGSQVIRMLICKYIPGKHTTAIPRVASASEFIEPTQGFDAHQSVIPPSPKESLQNQFDRSQVYIYEINKLLQPASHPRQVLPYAIVSYTQDGVYLPSIDAEPTPAEKLAGNPRLQSIVKAINSKNDGPPTPGVSPGLPGAANGNGLITAIGRPSPANSLSPGGSISPTEGGSPLINTELAAKYGLNGLVQMASLPGPLGQMGDPNNPALSRIVSQINARLEAEERSKKATGSDIIAGSSGSGSSGLATPPIANGALNGASTPNGGSSAAAPVPSVPAAMANGLRASLPPQHMPTHSPLAPLALPNNMNSMSNGVLHQPPTQQGLQNSLQNSLLQGSGMMGMPPGLKAPASAYPAAGILGTLPMNSIPRSLPLTASRPFSPEVNHGAYNPHLLAAAPTMVSSAGPMFAQAQLANATYLNPGTMLSSQALGHLLQPQLAPFAFADPSAAGLNKEFALYPGAAAANLPGHHALTAFPPKDNKPGMAATPAAGYYAYPSTAFGQNMLLGQVAQPLKRTLSDTLQYADKRPKYF